MSSTYGLSIEVIMWSSQSVTGEQEGISSSQLGDHCIAHYFKICSFHICALYGDTQLNQISHVRI